MNELHFFFASLVLYFVILSFRYFEFRDFVTDPDLLDNKKIMNYLFLGGKIFLVKKLIIHSEN
jgi:hypothetical protein